MMGSDDEMSNLLTHRSTGSTTMGYFFPLNSHRQSEVEQEDSETLATKRTSFLCSVDGPEKIRLESKVSGCFSLVQT